MKVRGSLYITKDFKLDNTGGTTPINGNYLVVDDEGIVRFNDLVVPEAGDTILYPKYALVIDTLGVVYIAKVDNASGGNLDNILIWGTLGSGGTGSGDMLKSEFAVNGTPGIVDKAIDSNTVNQLTVETAVPIGAVFIDTLYDDTDVLKDSDTNSPVDLTNKVATMVDLESVGGEYYAGTVDPTGNNYPNTVGETSGAYWVVNGLGDAVTFTYTVGDLDTRDVMDGYKITWNETVFDIIIPPAVTWGSISGTIGNQTDLIGLLDAKVDDSQVLTDVPAGALFTDTIYDDTELAAEVALNTGDIIINYDNIVIVSDTLTDHITNDPHVSVDEKAAMANPNTPDGSNLFATFADITTALIRQDDGNGYGYVPFDRDNTNYGSIGLGALDLSISDGTIDLLRGATGDASFATGFNTKASGWGSLASGDGSNAIGDYAVARGWRLDISGYSSFGTGAYNVVGGNYSFVGGSTNNIASGSDMVFEWGLGLVSGTSRANTIIGICNVAPIDDNLFIIGNGAVTLNGDNSVTRLTPSDAFKVYKSGRIIASSFSLGDYGSEKDLATVEKVSDMMGTITGEKIVLYEEQQIFKSETSTDNTTLQEGDAVKTFIEGVIIEGFYKGNSLDPTLKTSYKIYSEHGYGDIISLIPNAPTSLITTVENF